LDFLERSFFCKLMAEAGYKQNGPNYPWAGGNRQRDVSAVREEAVNDRFPGNHHLRHSSAICLSRPFKRTLMKYFEA